MKLEMEVRFVERGSGSGNRFIELVVQNIGKRVVTIHDVKVDDVSVGQPQKIKVKAGKFVIMGFRYDFGKCHKITLVPSRGELSVIVDVKDIIKEDECEECGK